MGNSFLLIVAGLLLFYLVISDKWNCVEGFAACVTGTTGAKVPTIAPTITQPTLPQTLTQHIGIPNSVAAAQNWLGYGI